MTDTVAIANAYDLARARYALLGVDTDRALGVLPTIPVSLHCWQGDDVGGFENDQGLTGGGIQATGNYPGKARNADELRADLDKALQPHSRQASPQSSRHLRRISWPPRAARPNWPRTFRRLDRLGQVARLGPRFQRHVLFASLGGRWVHAHQPR